MPNKIYSSPCLTLLASLLGISLSINVFAKTVVETTVTKTANGFEAVSAEKTTQNSVKPATTAAKTADKEATKVVNKTTNKIAKTKVEVETATQKTADGFETVVSEKIVKDSAKAKSSKHTQLVESSEKNLKKTEAKAEASQAKPIKAINRGIVKSSNDVNDKASLKQNVKLKTPAVQTTAPVVAPAVAPAVTPTETKEVVPPASSLNPVTPPDTNTTVTPTVTAVAVTAESLSPVTTNADATQDIVYTGDQLNVSKSSNKGNLNKTYQYQIGGPDALARKVTVETDDGSTITETREPLQVVTDINVKSVIGSEYQMSRPIDNMSNPRGNNGNNAVQRVPSLGITW